EFVIYRACGHRLVHVAYMFAPLLLILPQVEQLDRTNRPAASECVANRTEDSALSYDGACGVLRRLPAKIKICCLVERQTSEVFGVRLDLFRVLALLFKKLQLHE